MIKGIGMRLQRVGNIKIGKKGEAREKNGKSYRMPIKSDHFTVTTMDLDDNQDWVVDDQAMKLLAEHGFGDKPKAIPVMLPFDSLEENLFTELAEYTQSGRVCNGDRETAKRIDHGTGEETPVTCPCERLESGYCKPRAILSLILPLSGRIGGVHQFRTTGWHSIEALVASLRLIQSLTGGILAGIPLVLTVIPKKVEPKGTGKSQTIYVVSIEFRGNPEVNAPAIEQLQMVSRHQTESRLASGNSGKAIAGHAESLAEDTAEDVQDMNQEFKGAEEQQGEDQAADEPETDPEAKEPDDFFKVDKPNMGEEIPF